MTIDTPALPQVTKLWKKSVREEKLRKGVLIVDDEQAFCDMVSEVISAIGYRTWKANSAEAAMQAWAKDGGEMGLALVDVVMPAVDGLTLIRQTRPNLVILDLMMPGLDGFGVVEAMKQDNTLQDIPIIVITAKTLTPHEKRWLDSQVDGLWEKGSFMDVDLVSHIRKKLP